MKRFSIFAYYMTTDQALKELFSQRAWHRGSGFNESTARVYKKRFFEGKLEIETQIKILESCGFKIAQQMQWEKNMKLQNIISSQAFWDIDFNKLDHVKHKDYIILKVFDYGKWNDIINIIHFYGENTVKQSLLNTEHMTEQALQIASMIFKINKKNFKCYTKKQYRPSLKRY